MSARPSIPDRIAEVKRRLSLSAVVEPHVKLSGSSGTPKRRGPCPFHGGTSSFAVFDAHRAIVIPWVVKCRSAGCRTVASICIAIRMIDAAADEQVLTGLRHGLDQNHSSANITRRQTRWGRPVDHDLIVIGDNIDTPVHHQRRLPL